MLPNLFDLSAPLLSLTDMFLEQPISSRVYGFRLEELESLRAESVAGGMATGGRRAAPPLASRARRGSSPLHPRCTPELPSVGGGRGPCFRPCSLSRA